ncbi:Hypothetical protein PROPAUS_1090 [Propionibacterium australiense]|uniref:Uncharacterized protein n=1 Tax=Propionibacterium australiense TaxID=119981 RepID=A0A383S5R5_9ACTN|nr:Hypothetical protein PROPAUS_1090 [Propionibacterium australiense]
MAGSCLPASTPGSPAHHPTGKHWPQPSTTSSMACAPHWRPSSRMPRGSSRLVTSLAGLSTAPMGRYVTRVDTSGEGSREHASRCSHRPEESDDQPVFVHHHPVLCPGLAFRSGMSFFLPTPSDPCRVCSCNAPGSVEPSGCPTVRLRRPGETHREPAGPARSTLNHRQGMPGAPSPFCSPAVLVSVQRVLRLQWCARSLARRYLTQLPQGRKAARVSELFRVRGRPLFLLLFPEDGAPQRAPGRGRGLPRQTSMR